MQTVRLRPLCNELDLNATRVEQWISRGYFKPSEAGVAGRARQLTKKDAVTLLALAELVDAGLDAATIHREVENLFLFKGRSYLVISRGELGLLVPASEQGKPAPTAADCTRVPLAAGDYRSDVVAEADLPGVLADPFKSVSIVVSLDYLLAVVDAAWERLADGTAD